MKNWKMFRALHDLANQQCNELNNRAKNFSGCIRESYVQ